MDETKRLSQICPEPNENRVDHLPELPSLINQTKLADSTSDDIYLVVWDYGRDKKECLRIVQFDPEICVVTAVGQIPYMDWPSAVVICAKSLFCMGDENHCGFVYEFDLVTRSAQLKTQLEEPVRWTASAASSHELIVSGGLDKSLEMVSTCSLYSPATNTWTTLRHLQQARVEHRMCWLSDGRVFVIGGVDEDGSVSSSVEMLERAWIPAPKEEASAEWRNVAPMKTGRYKFGCCIAEGRIIVAGGWTDDGQSQSVESFEQPSLANIGQWTLLSNLASAVGWSFLVPSADGLLFMDRNRGEMQIGRRKGKVASSEWDAWTWELGPKVASFNDCYVLASLSTVSASSK